MKTRPLIWCLAAVVAALGLAGCGGSSDGGSASTASTRPSGIAKTSTAPVGAAVTGCKDAAGGVRQLRVTNAECVYARAVAADWVAKHACQTPAGTSRTTCTVGGLRCLGTRTDRGAAVSCAKPGRSISFVVRRG